MNLRQISSVILLACSTAAAQSVGDDFFPLAPGNTWTYRYLAVSEEFLYTTGNADSGRTSYTILMKEETPDSVVWVIREARDITHISYSFWGGVTVFSRVPVKDTATFTLVEDLNGRHQIRRTGDAEMTWRSVFCVMAHTTDTSGVFRYIPDVLADTVDQSTGWSRWGTPTSRASFVLKWTMQRGVGLRSVAYSTPGIVGGSETTAHRLISQTILSAPRRETSAHPDELTMDNAYPNPFNAATVLSLSLVARERVVITIVDILGRPVVNLLDATVGPGRFSMTWNGSQQASGTYVAQVRTSRSVKCMKLMLLK